MRYGGCDSGLGGSHGREGVRHRAVGQRPHVLDDGLLPPERLPEGIARRVVRPVAHGHRLLHHGTDPLLHAASRGSTAERLILPTSPQ